MTVASGAHVAALCAVAALAGCASSRKGRSRGDCVIVHECHVEAAASDHAKYLSLNHVGRHEEKEGWPGFTGADVLTTIGGARFDVQERDALKRLTL